MSNKQPSAEALEMARRHVMVTFARNGVDMPEHVALALEVDESIARAAEAQRARWKAQRVSIIETLEEWEAAHSDRPEYQSAISDVLAWLNGDIP
jgi:hypothetical protein